jgi:hypothetical protein
MLLSDPWGYEYDYDGRSFNREFRPPETRGMWRVSDPRGTKDYFSVTDQRLTGSIVVQNTSTEQEDLEGFNVLHSAGLENYTSKPLKPGLPNEA